MQEAQRRGRPPTFNEDRALAAMLETFWSKGFSACSIDELAAAAQVSKPSLYAAFGDKRTMYLRALRRFAGEQGEALEAALDPDRPLAEGLSNFFHTSLERYMSGGGAPRGCLVFCTAPPEAVEQLEVRAELGVVVTELDNALERRFTAAKETGEVTRDADPQALASMAAATLQSLAIRTRAGETRERLESFIEGAVRVLSSA